MRDFLQLLIDIPVRQPKLWYLNEKFKLGPHIWTQKPETGAEAVLTTKNSSLRISHSVIVYLQFLSPLSYAVIAYGCAECPKLSCGREGCDTEFCYHCRQLWHPNQTCDQARRQRARHTSGGNDASTLYVFNEEPGGGETFSLSLFQTIYAKKKEDFYHF